MSGRSRWRPRTRKRQSSNRSRRLWSGNLRRSRVHVCVQCWVLDTCTVTFEGVVSSDSCAHPKDMRWDLALSQHCGLCGHRREVSERAITEGEASKSHTLRKKKASARKHLRASTCYQALAIKHLLSSTCYQALAIKHLRACSHDKAPSRAYGSKVQVRGGMVYDARTRQERERDEAWSHLRSGVDPRASCSPEGNQIPAPLQILGVRCTGSCYIPGTQNPSAYAPCCDSVCVCMCVCVRVLVCVALWHGSILSLNFTCAHLRCRSQE